MRVFDIGGRDDQPRQASGRVLTVPNVLSLARLAVLPVLWWDLVAGRLLRALALLIVFAATDWLDGYLARRLDQVSRLGVVLDPLSDRLFVVVVGIGFVQADLLPLLALLVVLARDLLVLVVGGVLVSRGARPPAVTRLGKVATFGVMAAFPLLLGAAVLGGGAADPQPHVHVLGWATLVVSVVLYWLAALGYARDLVRSGR